MAKPARVIGEIRRAEATNANEIAKLQGDVIACRRQIGILMAQVAEANLKLLYAMTIMEVKRTSAPSSLILTGTPPTIETGSLLEFYKREREAFLAKLESDYGPVVPPESQRPRETPTPAETQGNGHGPSGALDIDDPAPAS